MLFGLEWKGLGLDWKAFWFGLVWFGKERKGKERKGLEWFSWEMDKRERKQEIVYGV